MAGWKKVEHKNFTIERWSVSNTVKITHRTKEEVSQGVVEDVETEYWFDDDEFNRLREAIKSIDKLESPSFFEQIKEEKNKTESISEIVNFKTNK